MAQLRVDPLPGLLANATPALAYFIRRDVLGEDTGPADVLWDLPDAKALAGKQQADGSFRYPGGGNGQGGWTNYALVETFRQVRVMVDVFGMDCRYAPLRAAAEYVLGCQAPAGDIRGILGNQPMPYYHGALLRLLVRAGMAGDARVEKGFRWLLEVRQSDGGWVVPAQTLPAKARTEEFWRGAPVAAAPIAPSSSLATGMILPALAVHPAYRSSVEACRAAELLNERIFRPDLYGDRKGVEYWTKFQYPFWWPNILTLLTALGEMGYAGSNRAVGACLDWFVRHQAEDGLWPTGYGHGSREREARAWVGMAIVRALRQLD